jgi:lipid-A-disaccharide synthase
MLKTAGIILKERAVQFLLLESPDVESALYRRILDNEKLVTPAIIKGNARGCFSVSDFVFTSSGTATLECAIAEKPMIIIYKTSFVTAILFKMFTKTPFIGLVNIIAQKGIVPEILQEKASPDRLAAEINSFLSSEKKRSSQINELRKVKSLLGAPGGTMRAARIIKGFL